MCSPVEVHLMFYGNLLYIGSARIQKHYNCYFKCRADLHKIINYRDEFTNEFSIVGISDKSFSGCDRVTVQDNSLLLATPFYNVTLQRQVLFLRELKMLGRPTQSSD